MALIPGTSGGDGGLTNTTAGTVSYSEITSGVGTPHVTGENDERRGYSSTAASIATATGTALLSDASGGQHAHDTGTGGIGGLGPVSQNASQRQGARRRHSDKRATAHSTNKLKRARLDVGPKGSRTRINKSQKKKNYERKKAKIARHVVGQSGSGPTEEDIAHWHTERRDAQATILGTSTARTGEEEDARSRRAMKAGGPSLGSLTVERAQGTFRFLTCQVNNMSTHSVRRVKVAQITTLTNRYDADMISVLEPGINHGNMSASATLASYFDADTDLRSVSAFNKNENPPTDHQPGGAAMIATGPVLPYASKSGTDWRGLGRWSWYVLEGSRDHRTRVITAYNVGGNKTECYGSVYQQHIRYLQHRGIAKTPRQLFREDLLRQLDTWVKQGDRIVLIMDANEHVLDGPLCRELCNQRRGLGLVEISHTIWDGEAPNTYINGWKPIDGIWCSDSLEVQGITMLPFNSSVGDHRSMIFDITTRSLIGKFERKVVPAGCRRLSTANKSSLSRYTSIVEAQMERHKMTERLECLIAAVGDARPTQAQRSTMETLDKQMTEIQKHAEHKCRKILKPNLAFSEDVKYWHERVQAWTALINLKHGKVKHKGHCRRAAISSCIKRPLDLSMAELKEGLAHAKANRVLLKKSHHELRRVHLRDCLIEAEGDGRQAKADDIRATIDREDCRRMWYKINRSQKDARGKPIIVAQKAGKEGVFESTTQEETEELIFEENKIRFQLATEAPIESTTLINQLGYLADTEVARQIVNGTYNIPDDVDDKTTQLLEEIGRIGAGMKHRSVSVEITPEEFCVFWRRVRESTSSSYSGIHFGHYRAAATSSLISTFLARKISLVGRTGCPPERWGCGLTIMLEKIAGLALVNRLRAILLFEADANMHNKLIFGDRMLSIARDEGLIPEEHFSDKGKTAEDGKLSNILLADISRQKRRGMSKASEDAQNCYDRVHHALMALCYLAVGVREGSIRAMLRTIQLMKFYLRTGWGESQSFIGGDPTCILHGLCQGNGAAPASWLLLSSFLISIHKQNGHGVKLTGPVSYCNLDQMGIVFVDDTDLYTLDRQSETGVSMSVDTQAAVDDWGTSIIVTGGGLKPAKCHYYMWDYECTDGQWTQVDVLDHDAISVPLPNGTSAPIAQHSIHLSQKTLGIYSNPCGCYAKQVDVLIDTIQTWTTRVSTGKLPAKWAWVSYSHQLWAKLRYGLGTNGSPLADLLNIEEADGDRQLVEGDLDSGAKRYSLRALYRIMLPYLGINRNIRFGWRHLLPSFGGVGLRRLVTETIIARANLFVQHFGATSAVGTSLMISLEHLQLEIGTDGCPLELSYHPLGPLTTPCWCRSLWEGLSFYKFNLVLDYPIIPVPREGDQLLIRLFLASNPTSDLLVSLQRCRIVWKALFVSDVATADGRRLSPCHLLPPTTDHPARSTLDFAPEEPTLADWERWAVWWSQHCNCGLVLPTPVGRWLNPSHRPWEWRYHADANRLSHIQDQQEDQYDHAPMRVRTRSRHVFQRATISSSLTTPGLPCSVQRIAHDKVALTSVGSPLAGSPNTQTSFWEFLLSWGGAWMWEEIENDGNGIQWILNALTNGTAVLVTDGSYFKDDAPHISGAGWVLKCLHTGHRLVGSFHEQSVYANSYRAERLGLLACHVLVAALSSYFSLKLGSYKICCDNEGALTSTRNLASRVTASSSQADIDRVLRDVKLQLTRQPTYEWVKSHLDDVTVWENLTIVQQLNVLCDALAKGAVRKGMLGDVRAAPSQLLPREQGAIIINGVKEISDASSAIRFVLGRKEAARFYTTELGWTTSLFDTVDWKTRHEALIPRGQNFKLWLTKQSSGFCGTQSMVAHWDPSRDGKCPDCGGNETSSHLLVCPNRDRTSLLRDQTADFHSWLLTKGTHPDLAYWVPKFVLLRNTRRLSSLSQLPPTMHQIARDIDTVGWRHFMEGKVPHSLFRLQTAYATGGYETAISTTWGKDFVTQLLHLSHAQWLYRNMSLHDRVSGYLQMHRREQVLLDITRLAETDPAEVPADSRYLLEIDFTTLAASTLHNQSYWLLAIKAARRAGQRTAQRRRVIGDGARARRLAHRVGRRGPPLSLRTLEVEHDIERDHGQRLQRTNKRKSLRAEEADLPSTKRLKPD